MIFGKLLNLSVPLFLFVKCGVIFMPFRAFVSIKSDHTHKIMAWKLLSQSRTFTNTSCRFLKSSSTSDTRVNVYNMKCLVLNLATNYQLRHEVMSQVWFQGLLILRPSRQPDSHSEIDRCL